MRGRWWGLLVTAVIVFLVAYGSLSYYSAGNEPTISYTEFSRQVDAGNVSKIYSKGDAIQGQLKSSRDNPEGGGRYTKFKTQRPAFADDRLWQSLSGHHVTVTAQPVVQERGFLANLLLSLAPIALLVALWIFFARRIGSGLGGP
ncbi:cell division protein FtsH, partial [Streptomyces sp. NTH33]